MSQASCECCVLPPPHFPGHSREQEKKKEKKGRKQPKATTRWKTSQSTPMPPTKPQLTNNQWPNGVIRGPNILSALSLPMGSPWWRRFWNHLPCLFEKETACHRILRFSTFLPNESFVFQVSDQLRKYWRKVDKKACCQLASFLGWGMYLVSKEDGKSWIYTFFCQGYTKKIANRFNLSFTTSPLPLFSIPVLSHNRENIHLLQHGLSLELTGTFHTGWHSTVFRILLVWESMGIHITQV